MADDILEIDLREAPYEVVLGGVTWLFTPEMGSKAAMGLALVAKKAADKDIDMVERYDATMEGLADLLHRPEDREAWLALDIPPKSLERIVKWLFGHYLPSVEGGDPTNGASD